MDGITVAQLLNEPLLYLSGGVGPGADGLEDMRVVGSAGDPAIFEWKNTTAFPAGIVRLAGHMVCGVAYTLDKFGDLPALTNGVLVQASFQQQFRTFATLHTNSEIVDQTGDMTAVQLAGSGTTVPFLWINSSPLIIQPDDAVRVVVRDNLTGLVRLRARLGGAFIGAGFQGSVA